MHTLGPAHPCAYRRTPVCKATCAPVCKQPMHTPAKNEKSPQSPYFKGLSGKCTLMRLSHKPTDHREHIVHIDGVTGSSPVATTNPRKSLRNQGLSSFLSSPLGCSNPPRTNTDKNPARSFHCSPRDFFISVSGNVAGVLLHADPKPDADRVIRANVDPLHQPRDDHPPGFRLCVIEGFRP